MIPYEKERTEVLEIARTMLHKGHVIGTSGNVSMRLKTQDEELYAITPSDMDYDEIEIEDIVIMSSSGKRVKEAGGKRNPPSVEKMLHIGIYQKRSDVGGIIHTHSLFPSAVSLLIDSLPNEELPAILEDQTAFLGGAIKIAKYAPSGTLELAKNVSEVIGNKSAVILRHHGAVCVGKNLKKAYRNVELLNKTAQIFIYANSCGKITHLSPEAVEKALHLYQATRQI